jgi:hypothetical protein
VSVRGSCAVLALAAAAAACAPEKREAERAVRAYDEAVILAHRTHDLARLREVATAGEGGKVVALVDLKTQSRLVLESELQSLEVTEVERRGPGRMVARTRERWRYWDRPLDPGRPQGTVFVADMAIEYQLVREGNGPWKTDATRSLSNEFIEPKGFRLGPGPGSGGGGPEGRGSR